MAGRQARRRRGPTSAASIPIGLGSPPSVLHVEEAVYRIGTFRTEGNASRHLRRTWVSVSEVGRTYSHTHSYPMEPLGVEALTR